MSDGSFTRKQLIVTFDVVNQDGSHDSLTLAENHRIRATISHAGMSIGSELALTIEGMSPDKIARLSYLKNTPNVINPTLRNQSSSTVTVRAGTYGTALPIAFHGMVWESYASFNGGSSTFTVKALTVVALAKVIPPALSYRGPRTVSSIFQDICTGAGITLVDHGGWDTYGTLYNHYVEGTKLDQIEGTLEATGGTYDFVPIVRTEDHERVSVSGTLHIWGPNYNGTQGKPQPSAPLISSQSGMVGYPNYSATGLTFSCLFRQDIAFYVPLQVSSQQMPAGWQEVGTTGKNQQGQTLRIPSKPYDGLWLPIYVSHDLSAEVPNGPWFTTAECQRTDMTGYVLPH
ncbi:hypothetical protein [Saccharibacter floricola]|uniref:Uncharacterized protein n=1 Tax=Saccharibacter floricola DSM 15669 TaxID=1123227 RepID=A0ABQ0NZI4_9PROT|nr:hypothetical protein [Saccharibacter floricola]GBQ07268.1 hypothetical protein AA15669_1306 [Saccharibacter floricola DSM 15669]